MKSRKRQNVSLAVDHLEGRRVPSGFSALRLEAAPQLADSSPAAWVELNPQPLPPRADGFDEYAIIIVGG